MLSLDAMIYALPLLNIETKFVGGLTSFIK